MRKNLVVTLMAAAAMAGVALVHAAGPATTQSGADQPSPQQMLDTMLKPPVGGAPKPLQPIVEPPAKDNYSGIGSKAVAPKTPTVALHREGTFIFDRVGRLTHNGDGTQAEFTFEADGKTLRDPPVVILPNLKLMTMEDAVKSTNRDLRFRVTGMLTEYRGRNYLLLEKVLVPPEGNAQF
ncbi:MAG TPA: hypothetical protein VFE47_29330 [Tepidisphaeraceae bacterium]|jgi:hypothetical protein|nr:hypothetical protein [Tepidisphaeraceae bacterium]